VPLIKSESSGTQIAEGNLKTSLDNSKIHFIFAQPPVIIAHSGNIQSLLIFLSSEFT